jgi:hypothetical protein
MEIQLVGDVKGGWVVCLLELCKICRFHGKINHACLFAAECSYKY